MKVKVEFQCRSLAHRGDNVTVEVDEAALNEYRNNTSRHVQDLFPDLSPAERELFVSGVCGVCWDVMFPPEDEED